MVLTGLSLRDFNCRFLWGLSFLSLPSALLLLNPAGGSVAISSIGTTFCWSPLLRVLVFLRGRLGLRDWWWEGTLRCRLEAKTVKREEEWLMGFRLEKEGLRGERRGMRRRRLRLRLRFETWGNGIVFVFVSQLSKGFYVSASIQ